MTAQQQYDAIIAEMKNKKEAGLQTDYDKAEYLRLTLKSIDLWVIIAKEKKQTKNNG